MLDLLEAFATVVEHTSLNQAAKRLNISQPALSRQVSRLEEELNVELFARHGKRLELTRVGQMTYDFALDIRSRQLSFMKSITAYKTEGQTNVTIGASLTTLQTTLPLFVSMFKEQYPDAQLKAVTGKTHEIVSYVRDKKVDFGIVGDAIREQGLVSIPLLSDHLMLVLPSSHELTRVKDWTMSHLNGVPMLLFSNGTWYRKLIDDLFRRYRIMPDIRMEIDSFEAIGRLLATCEATALLPKSYLRPEWLLDNRLIAVHLKELEQTERVTSLVYAEQAMLTESVRKFIAEAVIRSEWLGN
ncbi:LysR family transcriptional regulator [Paenibacillus sp. ACRRX]|uniref:LysR family transcriptional regulator n=1 Tax=Paenibacillus sp. ACRRX TaxID=2918206 RepID=UPI001EF55327|nr:LysR family transcriptional regulator [Paenibacillus sp. ACRRX]MCG7410533.1 LysR family transcriptional regulator [Paenibacillus sp. ACRRX]